VKIWSAELQLLLFKTAKAVLLQANLCLEQIFIYPKGVRQDSLM